MAFFTSEKKRRDIPTELPKKTSEKIIALIKADAHTTIQELAVHCGVSTRSIERNLKKLQSENKIKRIGPDKGGHWISLE
jgi:ATP-dependent DNA helicase RecG